MLVFFDTAGQVGVKLAGLRIGTGADAAWLIRVINEPLIYLVLVCQVCAFATYVSLLKFVPVGPSYAATQGSIVSVLIISILFLGERLTLLQSVGGVAILTGVTILAVTETPEMGPPPRRSR